MLKSSNKHKTQNSNNNTNQKNKIKCKSLSINNKIYHQWLVCIPKMKRTHSILFHIIIIIVCYTLVCFMYCFGWPFVCRTDRYNTILHQSASNLNVSRNLLDMQHVVLLPLVPPFGTTLFCLPRVVRPNNFIALPVFC